MKQTLIRSLLVSFILLVFAWSAPVALADGDSGDQLFETHCSGCHLNGGNIIRRGKTLKLKALEKNGYETPEAIAQIIAQGKNNMSAFSDRLSESEITQVSTFVWEQAQQGWS